MGFYRLRQDYSERICEWHPLVQHNQVVSIHDNSLRRSFFRINDEEELMASCIHWVHFPCVAMIVLSGGLINKDGSIRQLNLNTWMFLDKIILDGAVPVQSDAITIAYDRTFQVMQDFIRKIFEDYEENPGCGTFMDLDLGKFKWQQAGPIGDQLYGWELTFSDETRPFANTLTPEKNLYDNYTDMVLQYTYKATGNEGSSVTIPRIAGKEIVLLARENSILTIVEELPGLREAQRIGTTTVLTFAVELAKDEFIKLMYNN